VGRLLTFHTNAAWSGMASLGWVRRGCGLARLWPGELWQGRRDVVMCNVPSHFMVHLTILPRVVYDSAREGRIKMNKPPTRYIVVVVLVILVALIAAQAIKHNNTATNNSSILTTQPLAAPTWTLSPPVAADTPLPTATPDPALTSYLVDACTETDMGTDGNGCKTNDNPLHAPDVPRAFIEIRNVPDDVSRLMLGQPYTVTISLWRGSAWQWLGSWQINDLGGHNCRMGLAYGCTPSVFAPGLVRPGTYRFSFYYAKRHLVPFTLTIVP